MAGSIEQGLLCGVPLGRRRTSEESRDISPVYFGISAIEKCILISKNISQDKMKKCIYDTVWGNLYGIFC